MKENQKTDSRGVDRNDDETASSVCDDKVLS
jgi:hypothetical protein